MRGVLLLSATLLFTATEADAQAIYRKEGIVCSTRVEATRISNDLRRGGLKNVSKALLATGYCSKEHDIEGIIVDPVRDAPFPILKITDFSGDNPRYLISDM